MKQGTSSLSELARELERQQTAKRDFLSPTPNLSVVAQEKALALRVPTEGAEAQLFPLSDHGLRQITAWVPKLRADYFDEMAREIPDAAAGMLTAWMQHRRRDTRLVRTLDGEARAWLSASYRVIDHMPVLEAALQALQQAGVEMEIHSQAVTHQRLYLKVIFPGIAGEIRVGEQVRSAQVLSNSEVGDGACKLEQMVYTLVCRNGMVAEKLVGRTHVGQREIVGGEFAHEIELSLTTQRRMNAALLSLIGDGIGHVLNQRQFERLCQRLRLSTELPIEAKPAAAVEVAAERFGLSENEGESILEHLLRGGDLTAWGLSSAITRASQDIDSYDRATELESVGGKVIELKPNDWVEIAGAEIDGPRR